MAAGGKERGPLGVARGKAAAGVAAMSVVVAGEGVS